MIRVGVLRGGISPEYEISLKTGANVLAHLTSEKMAGQYKALDILIDRDGLWHLSGVPVSLEKLARSVDVVFNALHGDFGEDGKVQKILEDWKIPYTGSSPLASAVGYNKELSKKEFSRLGIKTPQHFLLPAYQDSIDGPNDLYATRKAHEIFRRLSPPWILKPIAGGSSLGIRLCKTLPDLMKALEDAKREEASLLVEEMIIGKEATVGVLDDFRGKEVYALPPIEIRPPEESEFFDYDCKYDDSSQEICPGNFSVDEKRELERLAELIHSGMGLSHYSRSDFMLTPRGGIYAIEVNTLPGLTAESLLPKALDAVGSHMPEFLEHVIALALKRK